MVHHLDFWLDTPTLKALHREIYDIIIDSCVIISWLCFWQWIISLIKNGKKVNPGVKIFDKAVWGVKSLKERNAIASYIWMRKNNCVCCDLTDFIMQNDDIVEQLRSERDKPNARPNWADFIKKITNK